MRESEIEKALCKKVKALKGEVRKVRFLDRRGAPDRLVMLPYETFFVELKAPGKKATVGQRREHARLRKYGWRVEVVDSLERVAEVLA